MEYLSERADKEAKSQVTPGIRWFSSMKAVRNLGVL